MAILTVCELLRAIRGTSKDNMQNNNAKKMLSRQKKDGPEVVTYGKPIGWRGPRVPSFGRLNAVDSKRTLKIKLTS